MSVQYKTFVNTKYLENAQTTQITSDAIYIIDKVTITNVSANTVSFNANICDSGEAVSSSNLIVKEKLLGANEVYNCFELIGQTLEDGSFLSMLASAANSLTIKIDGRIIT